jgi:uncharacterized membrane protein YphA (DoxX/SURF4 family)
MTTNTGSGKLNHLSPLLLRLAVAGILAYSGIQKLGGPAAPAEPAQQAAPAPTEAVNPTTPAANPEDVYDNIVGKTDGDTALPTSPDAQPIVINENGLKVDANMNTVLGVGELGFALALFVGLLIRFVSLAGLAAVGYATWAAAPTSTGWDALNFLVRIYDSNPLAMLLLGAICLTLLVTGSGPLGLDRVLFRREKPMAGLEGERTS